MHPSHPGSPPRAARLRLPVRLDIGGLVPRGQGRRRRPPRLQVPAHTRQRKHGNYGRRAPPLGRLKVEEEATLFQKTPVFSAISIQV